MVHIKNRFFTSSQNIVKSFSSVALLLVVYSELVAVPLRSYGFETVLPMDSEFPYVNNFEFIARPICI